MTSLRQRITQDLQLRGYSDRTVEAYVRAVAQLAQFYHASPDRLGEAQIRQYLLHLSTVQQVARGTHTIALCGITCFYQQTLGQPWTVLDVARPKRTKKLPVVLSRDEVWRILDGKGGKDRYVPLPDATLALCGRARGRSMSNRSAPGNSRRALVRPGACARATPARAPRTRILLVLEVSAARWKVQEASAARPRTGGWRSTPDCAAAARGTNLYFVSERDAHCNKSWASASK